MINDVSEAIVLAGGFGTRLQHVVNDLPKPMAMINGRPFLSFVLDNLANAGIKHVILSTGYKHECIFAYFGYEYFSKGKHIQLSYSQETEPLFTGGAIKLALEQTNSENVLVLNGDTLFDIDFRKFQHFHFEHKGMLTVALATMNDASRYGSVNIDNHKRIIGFTEKNINNKNTEKILINGGIYLINRKLFFDKDLPVKFSFEKEILEKEYLSSDFYGIDFSSYFIDIGIPTDFYKAQQELCSHSKSLLFIIDDFFINQMKTKNNLEFETKIIENTVCLSLQFKYIFCLINSHKSALSKEDLLSETTSLCEKIKSHGGHIDKILFSETQQVDHKEITKNIQSDYQDFTSSHFVVVSDKVEYLQNIDISDASAVLINNGNYNSFNFNNNCHYYKFEDVAEFSTKAHNILL